MRKLIMGLALGVAAMMSAPPASAQTIAVGASVQGRLQNGDSQLSSGEFRDTYTLNARAGQRLTIRLSGEGFDPYLMVRGPGDFTQDNDDDSLSPGSVNSRLDITVPANGEMDVVVTSFQAGETGSYTLSVEQAGAQQAASGPASNAPARGGAIALGQSMNGRLAQGDQTLSSGEFVDMYTFTGRRGQQVDITLTSSDFDPYIGLRGPGDFSAFNDDDIEGGSTNSRLIATLPTDGVYTIQATSYAAGESGAYRLGLATATGGAGAAQPVAAMGGSIRIGQSVNGSLANGDSELDGGEFIDNYSFIGEAGQRVVIDLRSAAFDTYLILAAPSGAQEDNDDAGGATNSRIETVLAETGEYRVGVTSYAADETGAYSLSVTSLDEGRAVAGASGAAGGGNTLRPGASAQGALAQGDDTLESGEFIDRFTFTGRRGQSITIDMASTAIDSYLIVRAPSGVQEDNDDANGSRNSQVQWTLPEDGTYSVIATSYAPGETGAYTIRFNASAQTAGPGPSRPAGGPGRRVYALSVGISDYGGRGDLPHTADDARNLSGALRQNGTLAPGSITLVDAQATVAGVRQAFQQVAAQAGPEDIFLFFYSGHGGQRPAAANSGEPDGRDETLVLRDGQITDDEVARMFEQVRARVSLLVLDACFSGGFARDVVARPGVMGLFSSEEDLTSAVADKFEAGGYLSHFIRTGLAGEADENRNGVITAGELSVYLRRRFSEDAQGVQSVTSEGQRNYQFLVVDRGGVKVDDMVLALR